MKRDAILSPIFKRVPGLLFELVKQPPVEAANYRFESVEVKEPTFRIDGVFLRKSKYQLDAVDYYLRESNGARSETFN